VGESGLPEKGKKTIPRAARRRVEVWGGDSMGVDALRKKKDVRKRNDQLRCLQGYTQ